MGNVIYSMTVSLDGFIADRSGEIDWSAPDPELFRVHTDRVRELDAHLCGRRLYETMLYWERPDPARDNAMTEFASIWQALPKIVFSTRLESLEGNATLATADPATVVEELRESGKDVEVGGAGLAAALMSRDLIDDYRLFVSPIVLGGGTPYFAPVDRPIKLRLAETRTFASRVVYLRYERRS
jgi:dihydrofolate reductase